MPEFVVEFDRKPDPSDDRLDAAAYHRNVQPMRAVLESVLAGRTGAVLEVGSGTGQHAVAFATAMPALTWWPTDPNPRHLSSIAAWRRYSGLTNIAPPVALDVSDPSPPADLPPGPLTAVLSMNVIHIAPWAVCEGLMTLAGRLLGPRGLLVLYGPFAQGGQHTAPSNAAFDASLREQNPDWGVRDVGDVTAAAAPHGLDLDETREMPSNNLTLVFRRRG